MNINNSRDQLLVNLMSAAVRRNQVLTGNLVNQNTPGYTRQTVEFEDILAAEFRSETPDLLSVEPVVLDDILTPKSADGNNVNMELEMTGLMQNRLQYELYSTILAGRMELMRSAIQGGR
ncbi:MAG: flagellar basal body rod protein FlgB [bacterium]|jgi:flagellar basal-body rod protein FlgB|nr:flagellar basal body rod protein FlgB [Planctomycetota bacterium]HIL52429.1 flagellar basal body rod protein FlgB [Planctomycetota bacterium]